MPTKAPYVDVSHQDIALTSLVNKLTTLYLCTGLPADYADAVVKQVVTIPVNPSMFSLAAGDIDGRKVRFAGAFGTATAQQSVTHAVFVNDADQVIHLINNITTTQVADQGKVTVNAFDVWEVGDPK